MNSLHDDITLVPYNDKYSKIDFVDNYNTSTYVNLNNKIINVRPFNVENLNNRFYLFLNANNIVEFVGETSIDTLKYNDTENMLLNEVIDDSNINNIVENFELNDMFKNLKKINKHLIFLIVILLLFIILCC